MTDPAHAITVLCVDDNPDVAEALRVQIGRTPGFVWGGWAASAAGLGTLPADNPSILLLDIDMPGPDPFEALEVLLMRRPGVRALVFSGHVRPDMIARALEAGAWGYVSKNDGEDELVRCLRAVASGEFAMSPEVRRAHDAC